MTQNTDDVFRRIRGLLKKAESTPFEEEAAAFMAKAQELITRHSVDEELLWASDPSRRSKVETIKIPLKNRMSGSYNKKMLLNTIARQNSCQCWYWMREDQMEVAGYPNDLIFVEMLYSSINVQLNFALAKSLALNEGTMNTRAYKRDFTAGFCDRVVSRLQKMKRDADEYIRQNSEPGTDLVLASRQEKVNNWVKENVPGLRMSSQQDRSTHSRARAAGDIAGSTADISGGRGGTVTRGNATTRRELPSAG